MNFFRFLSSPQQRHSHPELDFHVQEQQEHQQQQPASQPHPQQRATLANSLTLNQQKLFYMRPVSDANSESSFDGHLADKPYKSNNDVRMTSMRIAEIEEDIDDKRNSIASDSGNSGRLSVVRRQIPKHQRPLTRYLPIMSSDLDLRQHIETAGHQIALCPHVTVDSTSCRG
jgi:pleckstrin homology-like domain family B